MLQPNTSVKANTPLRLLLGVTGLLFISIVYILVSAPRHKIGYVNSGQLLEGYLGMKEARNQYQSKTQDWQRNLDTLERDFQKAVSQYQLEHSRLSVQQRQQKEATLQQMRQNLLQYSTSVQEKARKQDEQMTQGVLNQINSFVQTYGQQHGYAMILGTTLSGSLLYGEAELDITQPVLLELNQSYNPITANPSTSDSTQHENQQ